MLRQDAIVTGPQPGLLTAVLIALAGGWAASRLMRTDPGPFPSLVLGVTGAVLGLSLAGALGLRLSGVGLLVASVTGGVLAFASGKAISNAAERRRNRNHKPQKEFESSGSTGRTQEDS
jgi:uncharacterized membrane protein YeaQ/YmgE (transglycosylase-associated protein family)